MAYVWHICYALNLGIVHIFKSGGSTANSNLWAACVAAHGNYTELEPAPYIIAASHLDADESAAALAEKEEKLPAEVEVITFVRDPLNRWMSSYHEENLRAARRRAGLSSDTRFDDEKHLSFVKTFNALGSTPDQRQQDLADSLALSARMASESDYATLLFHDDAEGVHYLQQKMFATRTDGSPLPLSVYHVEDLAAVLAQLYWSRGSFSKGDAARLASRSNIRKRVNTEETGLRRYTITLEDLSAERVREVCLMYAADYCFFGLDVAASGCAPHARAIDDACETEGVRLGLPVLLPGRWDGPSLVPWALRAGSVATQDDTGA